MAEQSASMEDPHKAAETVNSAYGSDRMVSHRTTSTPPSSQSASATKVNGGGGGGPSATFAVGNRHAHLTLNFALLYHLQSYCQRHLNVPTLRDALQSGSESCPSTSSSVCPSLTDQQHCLRRPSTHTARLPFIFMLHPTNLFFIADLSRTAPTSR